MPQMYTIVVRERDIWDMAPHIVVDALPLYSPVTWAMLASVSNTRRMYTTPHMGLVRSGMGTEQPSSPVQSLQGGG
jgi:hypothetical protein